MLQNYPLHLTCEDKCDEQGSPYQEWSLRALNEVALRYATAVSLTPSQALKHLLRDGR